VTKTQESVLAALAGGGWMRPADVAAEIGDPFQTAGGAARSLHALRRLGKVERRKVGMWRGRVPLYEWRKAPEGGSHG